MKTFKQLREESTALQPVKMMVVFSDGERKSYDVPKDTSFKDYVEKKIVPVEQGREVVHYGIEGKPSTTHTTVTSVKEAWEQTGKEGTHRETGEKTFEYKKVKTNKDGDVEETGERCWKNSSGKMMGEDVEQLDELSPKTLGSYIKKAKSSAIGSSQVMGMGSNMTGQKTQDKAEKTVQKRASGINTAVDRLTKESVLDEKEKKSGLKDACWDGYEAIGMKDKNGKKVPNCVPVKESESLDEVSRNTLASYIKQAIADKEVAATAASYKSGKAGDEYNKAKTSNIEAKRGKGIETALGKLTKESVSQNEATTETNYEYKNKAGKKANLASIKYSDGDVEHITTTMGGRPTRHSTKEKAHASLRVRGFEPISEAVEKTPIELAKTASVKAGKSGSRQNHNLAAQAHAAAVEHCEQNGDDEAAEFHRQRADFHTNNSLG